MNPKHFLLFLLFTSSQLGTAQEQRLKGMVHNNQSQESLPFATVVIFNGDKLIEGRVTNDNGEFEIRTPTIFSHLEISSLGFIMAIIPSSDIDFNTKLRIGLNPQVEALDEVVLKTERTTTQQKLDRKIINLGSDLQQAGVNALESFDQIPEVQVDMANGTVALRGSDNIRILVNGKLTPQLATELLQQIPASQIDRVEIITAPSSKYRADGLSGLINIILKEKMDQGLNFNPNATTGTRRYSFGMDANYNLSFINFRLNASRSNLRTINNQTIDRNFSNDNKETIFTPNIFDGDIYRISGGFDAFLKDRHEFSFTIDHTDDSHNYFNESLYTGVTDRDDFEFLRVSDHFHYINILNANYRLNFDREDHFVEVDYNINSSNNDYPLADFEDGVLVKEQSLTENFVLQSLAMDHNLTISDKLSMETGFSRNTQNLDSKRLQAPETIPDRFTYDETLWGIYSSLRMGLGKFQLQTGLRWEQFKSESINAEKNFVVNRDYSNIFPSVHLSYSLRNGSLSMGYNKRISRPNFHHINAFQIVNPLYVWEFNPNITPEYSHNIEFNYLKRLENMGWGLTAFNRKRQDVILWTEQSTVDQQVFRYENSGAFNSYGLEAFIDFKCFSFWDTRVSFNHYITHIDQSESVTWDRTFATRFQLKNTMNLSKKITLDITYFHNPKQQNPFNYIQSRSRFDIAARARLLQNRLSLNLRAVDIFNQNILERYSQTSNLSQKTTWNIQMQTRNFLISANYKLFENNQKNRNRKDRNYNEAPIE
ncbi:TonB-dependent receptor [Flagellimonas lutimaris]|uniref:TonB-dependent receptor n=1 Tax=Flagellimonas lutimaris TaxID=475082 RepID=A0A3A1N9W9_9FLAO|nr:outer membrane beta-barrel family protein [Allomuricauda lutimaris]RIV35992.1 TonB-dependent receptor [Allomuricauda lutimaris]